MFFGYKENKNPNPKFNGEYYLNKYHDVHASSLNPLVHYVLFGQYENRKTSEKFRSIDLNESTIKDYYELISKSKEFNKEWYFNKYPEVKKLPMDPIIHYIKIGIKKNYNPNSDFSSKGYTRLNFHGLKKNPNPLIHYISQGKFEGRRTRYTIKDTFSDFIYRILYNKKVFNFFKRIFPTYKQVLFFTEWVNSGEKNILHENTKIIYNNLDTKKIIFSRKIRYSQDKIELYFKLLFSKVIVIDSGFDCLNHFKLRENQKIVQVWHACGAFKKIAFDLSFYNKKTIRGFYNQFSQYDSFIVSSENIRGIYASAHKINKDVVKALGIPRTDLILDLKHKENSLEKFYNNWPELKNKTIILYSPTLRDQRVFNPNINWEALNNSLNENEIFIIKRHIAMNYDILEGKTFSKIRYLDNESTFTLMFASDLMITDYSSVIFEYSLLNKPVIHYCPDYEEYIHERDFYLNFPDDLYGTLVKDSDVLIKAIRKELTHGDIDIQKLKEFKQKNMEACDGKATERVVNLIEHYLNS
ncbi:MAG: CDP-glycerol glycerophosphotransferase family protein [Methanobacteriaceae archaeon]|nr:CDP-glycerol glycerophosphotransferase family protein [Candidatus Methanorudis spinitermitis]